MEAYLGCALKDFFYDFSEKNHVFPFIFLTFEANRYHHRIGRKKLPQEKCSKAPKHFLGVNFEGFLIFFSSHVVNFGRNHLFLCVWLAAGAFYV